MSDQITPPDEPLDIEHHTLEQPYGYDIDWGGDGVDTERPVRAHVLAALQPSTGPFEPPLDQLLVFGEIDRETLSQRVAELGIGQQHVPELVRMARDRSLITIVGEEPEGWGPVYATQILEMLDVSDVVADLIPILDVDLDRLADNTIAALGAASSPAAVEPLAAYANDHTRWSIGRNRAIEVLYRLVKRYPDIREQVIAIFGDMLANAEHDSKTVVSELASELVSLKATETLPLIRRAFELQKVDEFYCGSWGDVLKELGVKADLNDPLLEESRNRSVKRHNELFPPEVRANLERYNQQHRAQQQAAEQQIANQKRKQTSARKQKNKRKTASASRKANRKKR